MLDRVSIFYLFKEISTDTGSSRLGGRLLHHTLVMHNLAI